MKKTLLIFLLTVVNLATAQLSNCNNQTNVGTLKACSVYVNKRATVAGDVTTDSINGLRFISDESNTAAIRLNTRTLVNLAGNRTMIDWEQGYLQYPSTALISVDWVLGDLYGSSATRSFNWANRIAYNSAGNACFNYSSSSNGIGISNVGTTHSAFLKNTYLTANRTIQFPDSSGRLALTNSNVASASILQTARNINGVSFNGSSDITVPTFSMPQNTIVLIGDSYTAQHKGGTAPGVTTPTIGYFNWANMKMKRKFHVLNYAGVTGQTTTQIAARFSTDALALNPGWVCIQGGVNDVNASTAFTTILSNLTSMSDAAIAKNIKVIMYTIPLMPVFSTQAKYNIAHNVNAGLRQYARGKSNVFLIDMNAVITDPATGIVAAAYTYDNTHLSVLGCAFVGDYTASKLDAYIPEQVDMLPWSANDTYANNSGSANVNLRPNGMLTGNTSGLATSWFTNVTLSTGGSGVLNTDFQQSKVSEFDAATGNYRTFEWQELKALTASGAEKRFAFRPSTSAMAGTWAVGDYLYLELEFEADNDWVSATRFHAALNTLVSSGSIVNSIDMFTNGTTNGVHPGSTSPQYIPRSGVLRTYPVQMTSLVTAVYPEIQFYCVSGTVRIGRVAIRKATPVTVGGVSTFLY